MENNLMIFEGNKVEVFELNGQVLFNPKHVAEILDIADVKSSMRNFSEKQVVKVKNSDVHSMHFRKLNNAGENFLTESGVYKLVFKSRKPEAEKFSDWVTDEVLPTIRKHGAYMSNEVIERTLTDPDYLIQLATALKKEREEKQKMEQKIEADKPYTELGRKISETDDTIDIGEFAKILHDKEAIDIGRNRLFSWLRDNKYIMQNNIPYQKYINNNYFDVTEVAKGNKLFPKTLITGKGQVAILRKLQREFA